MNPVNQENQEKENSINNPDSNNEITNTFEVESAVNVKAQVIFNYLYSSKNNNYKILKLKNINLSMIIYFN